MKNVQHIFNQKQKDKFFRNSQRNKINKKQENKLPVIRGFFENPVNQEKWICENINDIKLIDGVEFLQVHKPENTRTVLMRKDALKKIKVVNF